VQNRVIKPATPKCDEPPQFVNEGVNVRAVACVRGRGGPRQSKLTTFQAVDLELGEGTSDEQTGPGMKPILSSGGLLIQENKRAIDESGSLAWMTRGVACSRLEPQFFHSVQDGAGSSRDSSCSSPLRPVPREVACGCHYSMASLTGHPEASN
jgi:hypothetical protein